MSIDVMRLILSGGDGAEQPRELSCSYSSDQWHFSPTFSYSVNRVARLRARSCRPKQQKRRASPVRFRGARPSNGSSLKLFSDEEAGLSGMVALMKMRESRLRWRVSTKGCGEGCGERFSEARYGEGPGEVIGRRDVSSGANVCRIARGEDGRP